jgi:hypothetical protein
MVLTIYSLIAAFVFMIAIAILVLPYSILLAILLLTVVYYGKRIVKQYRTINFYKN